MPTAFVPSLTSSRAPLANERQLRVVYPLPVALRLIALHRELSAQMKIRITEPTFWLGAERKAGDVLDNQQTGPFRSELSPGFGLKRVPQFVEMAEEIKQEPAPALAVPPPVTIEPPKVAPPASGSFAEATAAVLKPAPAVAVKPAANPLAARVRALTARRAKFQDVATGMLEQGEATMTKVETDGPAILEQAVNASHDELAAITDLGDSLKDMAAGNE